jgi:hypothetical protein
MPILGTRMSNYFGKQLSSRPILTTTSTANPTKSGAQTYQLRVFTSSAASIGIADSSSTAVAVSVPIGAGVVGEYLSITPGQWYLPGAGMSVTEMS